MDAVTGEVAYHDDLFSGADTHLTIGSFNNDDFIASNSAGFGGGSDDVTIAPFTQIDLADFGNGYMNEWVDIPSGPGRRDVGSAHHANGDFTLFRHDFRRPGHRDQPVTVSRPCAR